MIHQKIEPPFDERDPDTAQVLDQALPMVKALAGLRGQKAPPKPRDAEGLAVEIRKVEELLALKADRIGCSVEELEARGRELIEARTKRKLPPVRFQVAEPARQPSEVERKADLEIGCIEDEIREQEARRVEEEVKLERRRGRIAQLRTRLAQLKLERAGLAGGAA
ncbi:hypothetical protein [Sphingomonas morindae]|uniref:Uncharacterized protein n=1 Tax=Sphingomonas morindae TaxID=1541170 RepID=A0ABY4X429_9SPHN|nr:hypothetical protein [Sphingomonas morindae]USI71639.1 hypothetical protein LHA26_09855 [Sphingomonas morindae]